MHDPADGRSVACAGKAGDPEAVGKPDAIAAVDGIDVLHIGASDLSTEMGIAGEYTHEWMRAAFETVARGAKGSRHGNGSRRRAPGFRAASRRRGRR